MKLDKVSPLISGHNLQRDTDLLHSTASSWGLAMNFQKCAVLNFQQKFHTLTPISYTLNGDVIPYVSSYSDLGVVMDNELKFHEHCSHTACKAGRVAHKSLNSTRCRSRDFMMHILKVHI